LWLYVLVDGIERFLKNQPKEVLWFYSNADYIGSYKWICESLDIDPLTLRHKILTNIDDIDFKAVRKSYICKDNVRSPKHDM